MERSGVSAAVGTPGFGRSVDWFFKGKEGIRAPSELDCSVYPGTVFLICSGMGCGVCEVGVDGVDVEGFDRFDLNLRKAGLALVRLLKFGHSSA